MCIIPISGYSFGLLLRFEIQGVGFGVNCPSLCVSGDGFRVPLWQPCTRIACHCAMRNDGSRGFSLQSLLSSCHG